MTEGLLPFLTIWEPAEKIRADALSPVELTEQLLANFSLDTQDKTSLPCISHPTKGIIIIASEI